MNSLVSGIDDKQNSSGDRESSWNINLVRFYRSFNLVYKEVSIPLLHTVFKEFYDGRGYFIDVKSL